ncbi:MAG: GldG family protein [Oscillospiraceae bacterium]|nr:GldG family protein [Oscillospiraceae bacterium]
MVIRMKKDNIPQGDELRQEEINTPDETDVNTEDVQEAEVEQDDTDKSDETKVLSEISIDADEDISEEEEKPKKKRVRGDTRKLRYGGMATALTAVVVAAVVLVNIVVGILNDRFPITFDLTKDKLYTLSDDSRDVAKSIKKDTKIIVFAQESVFSSPSGDEYTNIVLKQFSEVIKQYDSLSGGKVKIEFVDLISNPTLKTRYSKYEATTGDILFVCGERWQKSNVTNLYTYDQQQSMYTGEVVGFASEVESVLSSNLLMVTSDFTPLVTVLTGHDEADEALSGIESVLKSNNYEIEYLDITTAAKFNEKSTLALIAAPKTDYSADEIDKISNWLRNDGKYNRHLAVVVNFEASCPNLYEFLDVNYGLRVTDRLIFETDDSRMYINPFDNFNGSPFGDIESGDFTEDIAGKRAIMPYTLQIIAQKESVENKSVVKVVTFPESSKLLKMADVIAISKDEKAEEPVPIDADEYPVTGMAYANKIGYDTDNNQYRTNVLVCGSMFAFIRDNLAITSSENERLLLCLMNGFTENKVAVTISNKPLEKTKLEFTAGQANAFFVIFVFAIPALILIFGIVVFIRRRRL